MRISLLLHRWQTLGSVIQRIISIELASYIIHLIVDTSCDENAIPGNKHSCTEIPNLG